MREWPGAAKVDLCATIPRDARDKGIGETDCGGGGKKRELGIIIRARVLGI